MTRSRGLRWAVAGGVLVAAIGVFGVAALQSPSIRESLRASPLFRRLNSPLMRSVDARLYNHRHQLLSAAELGDGEAVARIQLFDPMGLDRDPLGDLLVSDRGSGGSGRVVWRLGTDGTARILAGTGRRGTAPIGILARDSDLGSPQGLCVDATGRVYFADSYNHVILRIEKDGTLQRMAGIGRPGAEGDGGLATEAALNQPYDVRLDSEGSFYIADFGNHRIRKVTPDGLMHTVAGRGEAGYSGDGGPAIAARLNGPYGLYADARIGLLIADSYNHVIRVVDRRGYIRTLAGTGRRGLAGDGGPAPRANFDTPQSLSVSASGSIYVGDEHNHVIRVIRTDGSIHRVAGTGIAGFSPDGTPADSGRLQDPENILTSSDGVVLFTEAGNARVRYIGPDGRLGTIAGGAR